MTWIPYNAAKSKVPGAINLVADNFKVMLLADTYTPDIDAHDFRDDVEADEVDELTSTGYTAGGEALTGTTLTQDNANDRALWDADNPQWTGATITFRYAVIYKDNGGAASADELIAYEDYGSNQSVTSGTLTIQFDSDGILEIT